MALSGASPWRFSIRDSVCAPPRGGAGERGKRAVVDGLQGFEQLLAMVDGLQGFEQLPAMVDAPGHAGHTS